MTVCRTVDTLGGLTRGRHETGQFRSASHGHATNNGAGKGGNHLR
jgi:hypothetical protein